MICVRIFIDFQKKESSQKLIRKVSLSPMWAFNCKFCDVVLLLNCVRDGKFIKGKKWFWSVKFTHKKVIAIMLSEVFKWKFIVRKRIRVASREKFSITRWIITISPHFTLIVSYNLIFLTILIHQRVRESFPFNLFDLQLTVQFSGFSVYVVCGSSFLTHPLHTVPHM